jgi:hypothetical protein
LSQLAEFMEAPILQTAGSSHGPHLNHGGDDDATQTTLHGSNTMRVLLPNGEDHLDRSASEMIDSLSPESLAQLERMLTKVVLDGRGGLVSQATSSTDLVSALANPLIDQTTVYLSTHVPGEDVAAVEISAARGEEKELARRVQSYLRRAAHPKMKPPSCFTRKRNRERIMRRR